MKKILLIVLCFSISGAYGQKIPASGIPIDTGASVVINSGTRDEDEIAKIIVEFKDKPAVFLPKSLQKASVANKRSSMVMEYLSGISVKFTNPASRNLYRNITVKKEFRKIFSGIQMDIPRKYIPYLSGLDYVKKIHLERQVRICLAESVPLVKADKVWTTFSNKGKGIKVSIIDTGIDYLHEALGGGFGESYKVIGGYDFFNMDNDPMDDYGHGTHVAGIVAANSVALKGVAPEASLIACKVLDENGNGLSSTIIQGIEFSIDPNNDGDFSDAVDIINISLGGPGTPDDPVATAVNNACALGVVVCVSAGNDGYGGFYTIGSPGCAEKAITVGNTLKSKTLASSSSKGPVLQNLSIKPDVLAPGTDINSCLLSGGTVKLSGTSMSSPHLAGICALLKKQHPTWSPDEIKSAVKTTAEVLSYEPMEQGSGFVDAYKAISARTFVIPADLIFGLCDTSGTIWNPHKILKIKNVHSSAQSYTVNISSADAGINFSADKPSFTLLPGDSTTLDVQLTVNNEIVPFRNTGSNSYGGYARIIGSVDTLSIPWAFLKRQVLELKFELPYAQFILASDEKLFQTVTANWTDLYTAEIQIPAGNYDLMTQMVNADSVYMSIKQNLNLIGSEVITTLKEESNNNIQLNGKDEYGRNILGVPNSTSTLILYDKKKRSHCLFFSSDSRSQQYRISDIPDTHLLDCHQFVVDGDSVYRVVSFEPVSSQSSDITFANMPEDLVRQKVKLIYDKNVITPGLTHWIWLKFRDDAGNDLLLYLDSHSAVNSLSHNYWEGYVVRNERIANNPQFDFTMHALNSFPPLNEWRYSFASAPMRVKNKQFFMGPINEVTPDIYIEADHEQPVVIGDEILFGKSEYDTFGGNLFKQTVYFEGQMGDSRSNGGNVYYYKIYDSNNVIIDSGKTELENTIFEARALNSRLKTEFYQPGFSRFVDTSIALLTSISANAGQIDGTPPSLTSFQIRNSLGRPVDSLDQYENAQLRFSVRDPNLVQDSTKVFIKNYYSNAWTSYAPTFIAWHESIGQLYTLDLDIAKINRSRLLSIKVRYADQFGNSGEWLLNPVLKTNRVNKFRPQLTAIDDETILEDDTCSIRITCIDRDNDPIVYYVRGTGSHPAFEVRDTILRIIPDPNWNGSDELWLIATDGELSDSTSFTLNVLPVNDRPNAFNLISPQNSARFELNESNRNGSLSFSWSESTDIDGDDLIYRTNICIGDSVIDNIITSTYSCSYAYRNLLSHLNGRQEDEFVLQWNVIVSDGIDTVAAINNPFEFVVSAKDLGDTTLPTSYSLGNAYPNPFNPITTIKYDIIEVSDVNLTVYDTRGRTVSVLVNVRQNPGSYKAVFNASNLPSGVYFYALKTGSYSNTKKMVLIK